MDIWQIVAAAVVVAVPFLLLAGFWPRRERLGSSGVPLARDWRPAPDPRTPEDAH